MSITIENAEIEALLADLTETTRRTAPDLLLDVLRRERARVEADRERDRAEAVASGRLLHERTYASPLVDPRPINEILAYDENGLPV
ncbi:type II toxin-antitoxin system VapB family antitoxin [Methylobacterium sp. J-070]|uniref:type II toxin-antitoxin system VapB family antitoxin n=1 Tax=Methylobacterium sp. J-070 TaxID=2836650 RepID=UPI001FBAF26F|nr:type II toxin-antitoxin system VapB family antitoxin [Methylobacterium sp. J-070]MCJ2052228.1 type II toxin-antitoxin system VapB family antitoxin [Methylobacterium sp. J-070]